MKLLLFALLLATACTHSPTQPADPDPYQLADPVFTVLAQKALTYQTDFDTEAWADMLADSVVYYPPDSQPPWRGKAAVLAGWQRWQQANHVQTMRISGQTYLPVQTTHGLSTWGGPGTYVIAYYTAQTVSADKPQAPRRLRLSQCCHFNADKRIDLYLALH